MTKCLLPFVVLSPEYLPFSLSRVSRTDLKEAQVMVFPSEKNRQMFSWNDYKKWPEDERWQIIDGQAYCMTTAPNIRHQKVTGNMYASIRERLKGKPCTTFIAPTFWLMGNTAGLRFSPGTRSCSFCRCRECRSACGRSASATRRNSTW